MLEVHAVEAEDHRRHRGDRDPARDLAQVLVVADRELREVGLQHAGEQLVEAGDPLGVADQVVIDVAEVRRGARVERQPGLVGGEALHRRDQRRHRALELEHLALELVDPLGRVGAEAREDVGLDGVDLDVEALEHLGVVVDDAVGDGVEDRARPDAEEVGVGLEVEPHVVQRAALAVADGDHEARAGEHHHLADLDRLGAVHVPRGLEHEEQRVAEHLELRPLVGVDGVLDRQRVQLEALAHRLDDLGARVVEADPDEAVVARVGLARARCRARPGRPAGGPRRRRRSRRRPSRRPCARAAGRSASGRPSRRPSRRSSGIQERPSGGTWRAYARHAARSIFTRS